MCRDEAKFIKNNKIFSVYATNSSFQNDRPFVFKLHCYAMEKSILKSGDKQGNIVLAMRREECSQKLIMKTKFATDYLEYPVFHFNIQMKWFGLKIELVFYAAYAHHSNYKYA